MAKLYANENFPLPAVLALRDLGHDILTSLEAGKANQSLPDEAVLAYARQQGRVLLTLNRKHFIRLHQSNPDHPGIIVCTFDPDFPGMARRIAEAIQQDEPMHGRLARVNRPG